MKSEDLNQTDHLLVKAAAPWTEENAKNLIDSAKAEASKNGHRHILFDLTQWERPVSEMTRFYSGEYLARILSTDFKVAAFTFPAMINKFGENTAVNRGAWFQIFPDEASAIKWLTNGS